MTLTIKSFPEPGAPGKPGTPSQNSENSSGQSPRSNPVCLEVGVTIRNTPAEAGSVTPPFREEGRTVIVFDNGAVIRSTSSLPIGQTFILSNPNGRDVVCRVVGGRNLPSVKGYAEVEFVQPVKDFWSIHQDAVSVPVVGPPLAPVVAREPIAPSAPAPIPRAAVPLNPPSKPGSVVLGSGPSFDDIPGLLSKPVIPAPPEAKTPSTRLGPERLPKVDSDYNLSGIAEPTSVASWRPPDSELPPEKRAIAAMREALSTSTPVPVAKPSRDFMSKGLMSYEQPHSSSSSSSSKGNMSLVLGAAAVVLAGVAGAFFYLRQGTAPASVAKADAVSQPFAPQPSTIKAEPNREQAQPAQTRPQAQQSLTSEPVQPTATNPAVPAVVRSAEASSSRSEQENIRRQEDSAASAKQASVAATRRPAIPNLKIGSPSAPNQNPRNPGEDAAPMTEISSTESVGGTPSANLLTSSGRTSSPPAPPVALEPATAPVSAPVSAPVLAPKAVRDPKLISSVRPVYPVSAKQANIQGTVSVTANINAAGNVVAVRALSGPMLLRQAAEDAVKQWKYSPGTVDGKAAPSQVTLNVDFRLN